MSEEITTVACEVCGEEAVVRAYALGAVDVIVQQLPLGWDVYEEVDPVTSISKIAVRCPNHRRQA
jgi:hypothetical protein